MADKLNIGVVLPTRGILLSGDVTPDTELVLSLAERAEAIGCDSVWVGDSLTAKPRLEPLATLAAIAARTKRVRLGTSVLLAALRNPVLLAQMSHTIDQLSHGRLTLAIGVGGTFTEGQRREWNAAGVPAAERGARTGEIASMLRAFRKPGPVDFSGRFYKTEQLTLQPQPVQQPGVPLWLACHARTGNDRQYRRAARFGDGIMDITDSPAEFMQVIQKIRAFAKEDGRKPEEIHASYYMTVNLNENDTHATEEADTFLMKYYGVRHWGNSWGPFSNARRIVDRIKAYQDAGAQTVIVRFASFEQKAQLERFADGVLARLR